MFFHYSGHGGRVEDTDGDEDDGYDETLIPVDYLQTGNQIVDDVLYTDFVGALPKDCFVTCVIDCCHSGTVLDLPYTFMPNGETNEMYTNPTAYQRLQRMAFTRFFLNHAKWFTELFSCGNSGTGSGTDDESNGFLSCGGMTMPASPFSTNSAVMVTVGAK